MPHKPYWWRDIAWIRQQAEAISEPVLARRDVQRLFGVSHMEAQRIMKRIGCWKVGAQLVVSRPRLLEWLRTVERSSDYLEDEERRGLVEEKLAAIGRDLAGRRVRIRPVLDTQKLEGLPNVSIEPGRLTIEFFGTEDLLVQLHGLSQAIAHDWRRFQELCGD